MVHRVPAGRGLVHAHIIYRPAKMPEGYERGFNPGQRIDWVDEWVCARIPDSSVLRDFGMLGPASKFRSLSEVTETACGGVYKYLWDVDPETEVLHPDIVKDHGYTSAEQVIKRLVELTVAEEANGDDHWSLHPHKKGSHKAKMIHSHTKGIDAPDDWCKKRGKEHANGCKGHFIKTPAAYTHVNDEGWIVYRRGACDRMVVAYNPWLSLYFTSHINVELIATAHIFTYLFKYVLKGEDRNRAQIVVDSQQPRGEPGPWPWPPDTAVARLGVCRRRGWGTPRTPTDARGAR